MFYLLWSSLIFENFFMVNFYISYQNFCFFIKIIDLLPELLLLLFILYGLINLFKDKNYSIFQYYRWIFYLILVLITLILPSSNSSEVVILFGFSLIHCWYTKISKLCILILTLIVLQISKNKLILKKKLTCVLEFPIIIGFSVLFLFFLSSTYDFFGFYLAIEGLSLTLYVLAGMLNYSVVSIESAIKYFSLGAISTGILLFGISLLFGLVGSLDFLELQLFLSNISQNSGVIFELKISILFILFGFFFKLSAFPCHWWVADVYEGIWTPITAFFAIVIKVGLLLFFFRVIYNILFNCISVFQPIFIFVSIGSMLVGTFGALKQVRIKRFIAYASISQVGFIMLGLASSSLGGLIASISYLIIYVLMTIAFFILILNTEHIVTKKNIVYLSELYCFSIYSPKFARYLAIVLLSMAGIPPLGGFVGKLFIYVVAIDAGLDSAVFLSLLISIISTYYYLNFIHYTWFVKFNKIRLYYFNLNFVLNLFLIGILLLLIGFILIFPYVFSIATTLAFSCIWPFFFF